MVFSASQYSVIAFLSRGHLMLFACLACALLLGDSAGGFSLLLHDLFYGNTFLCCLQQHRDHELVMLVFVAKAIQCETGLRTSLRVPPGGQTRKECLCCPDEKAVSGFLIEIRNAEDCFSRAN